MSTTTITSERIVADLETPARTRSGDNVVNRWCKRLVLERLQRISTGGLRLVDGNETLSFGDRPNVTVEVTNAKFYRQIVFGGSVGAADAFIDGHWTTDKLTDVLRLFLKNRDVMLSLNKRTARIGGWLNRMAHRLRANTKTGSKRNIAEHYDLGNDFFQLFLDPTMMYSSAVFERDDSTLDEAAIAKLDRICRRLKLGPEDHVIEIGTGWGGFARYAAENFGCRVTTTTVSQEQYQHARQVIVDAGLEHLVHVICEDYRDLTGSYDKLVSIEMIEAVGLEHLETYFRKCSSLLKPNGAMLIQSITIADQIYESYSRGADFIQKYIFPGGALPSVSKIADVVGGNTVMRLIHLEDIAAHYARTCAEWRTRFNDQLDEVRIQGFPERFIRMWNYYLCYCEAGFEERTTGTSQLVFAKPKSKHETAKDDRVAERILRRERCLSPSVSD